MSSIPRVKRSKSYRSPETPARRYGQLLPQTCPDTTENQQATGEMDRGRWLTEDGEGQQRACHRSEIKDERRPHRAEPGPEPRKAGIGQQTRDESGEDV